MNFPGRWDATDRPSTRVVLLTVPSGDEDVEEAVLAGACGFLAKDTPIEEVVTAVRAAAQGVALALAPCRRGCARADAAHLAATEVIGQARNGSLIAPAPSLATPGPRPGQRSDRGEARHQPAYSQ